MTLAVVLIALCGIATQTAAGEVPVDDDDAELPVRRGALVDEAPPVFVDPADVPALDVAQLRSLRGKQLVVLRADGRVVKGGLLDVDNERIVLVADSGERVTVYAAVIRSWRVVESAPRAKRPPPDVRPSATAIALGAGAGTACGACVGGAGVVMLALTGQGFGALVLCPAALPLLTSSGGAALGFIVSDEEELPAPSIGIVMTAAVVGAVIGAVLGAFPLVVPGFSGYAVISMFLGATTGSAIAAHEVARQFAIARE